MKKKYRPFAVSACLLAAATLSGCASLEATPSGQTQTAQRYDEIYLVQPSQDPRKVFPRVVREFQEMGLQVHVVSEERFLGKAEGTGFLISETGHLLTAAHVLEGQKTATVWLDGTRYEADLVDQDAQNDLAVIKLRNSGTLAVTPLSFSRETSLTLGSDLYTVGHTRTRADGARLSKGMVSALSDHDGSQRHLQFSSDRRLGSSGAPLLSTSGTVVGMVQKASTSGQWVDAHHLAIRGQHIIDYVRTTDSAVYDELSFDRPGSIEQAARAVAKVKSGLVANESPGKPRLVAKIAYTTFPDKHPRFGTFNIVVSDLDTSQVLLAAGKGKHTVASTEETVIRSTLKEVRSGLGRN